MGHNKLTENDGSVLKNAAEKLGENLLSNFTGSVSVLPIAKYASAARVKLKINGNLVGFAFGVSWNIETSVTEIRTVDNYLPYELAPRQVRISGTLNSLHIPGEGPSKLAHQCHVLNFLQQKYVTIEVRDSQTDHLLFFTNRAMITSRMEDIRAEQLSRVALTWQAVAWKDEKEPNRPKDWKEVADNAAAVKATEEKAREKERVRAKNAKTLARSKRLTALRRKTHTSRNLNPRFRDVTGRL